MNISHDDTLKYTYNYFNPSNETEFVSVNMSKIKSIYNRFEIDTEKVKKSIERNANSNIGESIKDTLLKFFKQYPEFAQEYYDVLQYTYDTKNNTSIEFNKKHDTSKFLDEEFLKKIKKYANAYIDYLIKEGIVDYGSFVDFKKRKKDSLFMNQTQLEYLIKYSMMLKLLIPFLNNTLPLTQTQLNDIYAYFSKELYDNQVITILFGLVRSVISKYKKSDGYLFTILQKGVLVTPENLIFRIFNYISKNTIPILSVDLNPMVYISLAVRSSVEWFLKNKFDKNVVYTNIGESGVDIPEYEFEDNSESSSTSTELNFIIDIAQLHELNKIFDVIGNRIQSTYNIQNYNYALNNLHQNTIQMYVVFPTIAKIFNFDYNFLLDLNTDKSYYLQMYFSDILNILNFDWDLQTILQYGTKFYHKDTKLTYRYKMKKLVKDIHVIKYNPIFSYKILDEIYKNYTHKNSIVNLNVFYDTNLTFKEIKINDIQKIINNVYTYLKVFENDRFDFTLAREYAINKLNSELSRNIQKKEEPQHTDDMYSILSELEL